MKWKKLVDKQNASHYAWPHGWDTAETVAEQLECSPERVREHLAPSIRSGEVEVKQFTVWDSETGRKFTKTGFRMAGARAKQPQTPQNSREPALQTHDKRKKSRPDRWPFSEGAKICRPDNPERIGVMKGGRIHWPDGKVSLPVSRNQTAKLRLA